MARDEFDSAGEYVNISELLGKLVLFTPRKRVEGINTVHGDKDAVLADLVVLDGEDGWDEYEDVMIFQGKLIAALKRRITVTKSMDRDPVTGVVTHFETTTVRRLLGVIVKGQAQRGQNAPYELGPATDEQKALARKYSDKNPTPAPEKVAVGQYIDTGNGAPAPAATAPSQAPSTGTDEFAPKADEPTPFTPSADDPWAADAQ